MGSWDPRSPSSSSSGRAEAEVGEELAVQGIETLGIGLEIEPIHLDHIPLVLHVGIAEGYLVLERILANELHGLQVRVEVVNHC